MLTPDRLPYVGSFNRTRLLLRIGGAARIALQIGAQPEKWS
jgi:hypothetical protein